jgi:hypothetical protein
MLKYALSQKTYLNIINNEIVIANKIEKRE